MFIALLITDPLTDQILEVCGKIPASSSAHVPKDVPNDVHATEIIYLNEHYSSGYMLRI